MERKLEYRVVSNACGEWENTDGDFVRKGEPFDPDAERCDSRLSTSSENRSTWINRIDHNGVESLRDFQHKLGMLIQWQSQLIVQLHAQPGGGSIGEDQNVGMNLNICTHRRGEQLQQPAGKEETG